MIIVTSFYCDIFSEKLRFENFPLDLSNTREGVSSGSPKTEKRVENTTRSEVFEVSG